MTSLNLPPRLSAAAGPRPAPTADLPAVDETRGTPVGVVVAAKGGQKARQDAAEKEIEQRARRDRAERDVGKSGSERLLAPVPETEPAS